MQILIINRIAAKYVDKCNTPIWQGPPYFDNYVQCLVQLNNGDVLILGGAKDLKKVKRYNPYTNTFKDQADMIYERFGAGCAVFNSAKHGGREVVYIGGGTNNYLTKAEILDHTMTETWEKGNT